MGQIFISYARADSRVVDKIVKQIEDSGYQVWIDRGGIQAGDQWRASIVEAIEAADVVVIILSNESVKSENLRKEVDLSETKQKPLLPVKIEKVDIPPGLEYQLSGIQILDFAPDEIQSLLESIGRYSKPTPFQHDTALAESHMETEFADPKPTKVPSLQNGKGAPTLFWFFIIFGFIGGPLLLASMFPIDYGEYWSIIIFLAGLLITLGIVAIMLRVIR